MYKFMVRRGSFTCTVLPRLEYFDRLSNRWIIGQEEHEWEVAPEAPANDAWPEEVLAPPHQEVLEEIHAPPAHDAWYAPAPAAPDVWGNAPASLDYHPGGGSSSHWGDEDSSSQRGQQWPFYEIDHTLGDQTPTIPASLQFEKPKNISIFVSACSFILTKP
jgi:hypothetical protein